MTTTSSFRDLSRRLAWMLLLMFAQGLMAQPPEPASPDERVVRNITTIAMSTPPGAAVELNGEKLGITPCFLALKVQDIRSQETNYFKATPTKLMRPQLGCVVGLEIQDGQLKFNPEKTTTVTYVWTNTPAARMGLQQGDRITSVNGKPTKHIGEIGVEIKKTGFDQSITMSIDRNGQGMELKGRTDPPITGSFYPAIVTYTDTELAGMNKKTIHFDLRKKSGEPVQLGPDSPRPTPPPPPAKKL